MRVNYHKLMRVLRTQQGFGAPFSNIRYLSEINVVVRYEKGSLSALRQRILEQRPVLVPVQTGALLG